MRHGGRIALVASTLAAMAGCIADSGGEAREVAEAQAAVVEESPGCTNLRWVQQTTSTSCPVPPATGVSGHYKVSPLFDRPTVAEEDLGDPNRAPILQGWCFYEWVPTTPRTRPAKTDVDRFLRIVTAKGGKAPQRDCHVVAPLAPPTPPLSSDPRLWNELADSYHTAVDALDAFPAPTRGMERVRVAVIDSVVRTADDGEIGKGRYEHGRAVGRVIQDLACSDDPTGAGACIGQLSNHLALPLIDPYQEDVTNGGYFGTQAQLAREIARAVASWHRHNKRGIGPREPRLVLNLSLGWDTDHNYGEREAPLPAPVGAVYAALRHAVCRGALVVAAAGNNSGGATPSKGPMLPAAWEQLRAPNSRECDVYERGVLREPFFDTFPPRDPKDPTLHPLVYAVGGVDGEDSALASTRANGRPRLAAYGLDVTVDDPLFMHTDVLTGTSMSTAVVSGIATAVWGFNPRLDAGQVMDIVYRSGIDLEIGADFCLGKASCAKQTIHRVSQCRAIMKCLSEALPCPCESTPDAFEGENPSWPGGWSGFTPTPVAKGSIGICGTCGPPDKDRETKMPIPFDGPQPGKGGCEVCGLEDDPSVILLSSPFNAPGDRKLTFTVSLDPKLFEAGLIRSLVLTLDKLGGGRVAYSIPVDTQTASYTIDGANLANAPNPVASFLLGDAGGTQVSTTEPVLYWQ